MVNTNPIWKKPFFTINHIMKLSSNKTNSTILNNSSPAGSNDFKNVQASKWSSFYACLTFFKRPWWCLYTRKTLVLQSSLFMLKLSPSKKYQLLPVAHLMSGADGTSFFSGDQVVLHRSIFTPLLEVVSTLSLGTKDCETKLNLDNIVLNVSLSF